MLGKTALLIVSNPKQIGTILPLVQKQVKKTLYIHLHSNLSEPFGHFHPNIFNTWPKYSETIHTIYSQAVTHCTNLDVRVLLSGLKYADLTKIHTRQTIDLVIFDKVYTQRELDTFIADRIGSTTEQYHVLTLDSGEVHQVISAGEGEACHHAVLGGTFDRLHIAHKLLLSEAALRARDTVTVGVTQETMLQSKTLWELIEPIDVRMRSVREFLTDVCPELRHNVVPISDPFGPSIVDPTMDLIVVSEETLRGGQKINEIRQQKSLEPLQVVPVKLIEEPHRGPNEECKISSSTFRIRLLGTLLRPVEKKSIPNVPYVIGLTGGVASGKSSVTKWLSQHGAQPVNCDLIAHQVYKPGKPCHSQIVQHFGKSVLTPEGEIDRKVLGSIVFQNPDEMKKLNSLVWPGIADEVAKILKETSSKVVVVEAAVLLLAGWQQFCHEVWATLVPREEAIRRLKARNGLSEEQAVARIEAQPSNSKYVEQANVVICPLWEVEFTQQQVSKAWELLQGRIL